MSKPRVFKSIDKLKPEVLEEIMLAHPYGFDKKIIAIPSPIPGKKGKLITVLPFESEKFSYLIQVTLKQAQALYLGHDATEDETNTNEVIDLSDILEIEGEEKEKVPKKRGRPAKVKNEEEEEMA